jgi:hypothetical protein
MFTHVKSIYVVAIRAALAPSCSQDVRCRQVDDSEKLLISGD